MAFARCSATSPSNTALILPKKDEQDLLRSLYCEEEFLSDDDAIEDFPPSWSPAPAVENGAAVSVSATLQCSVAAKKSKLMEGLMFGDRDEGAPKRRRISFDVPSPSGLISLLPRTKLPISLGVRPVTPEHQDPVLVAQSDATKTPKKVDYLWKDHDEQNLNSNEEESLELLSPKELPRAAAYYLYARAQPQVAIPSDTFMGPQSLLYQEDSGSPMAMPPPSVYGTRTRASLIDDAETEISASVEDFFAKAPITSCNSSWIPTSVLERLNSTLVSPLLLSTCSASICNDDWDLFGSLLLDGDDL